VSLNITVVSRAGVHQSADFRISRTERGPDGNWIELQPNSSKIVGVYFRQWSALLTYCGIGLWNGKRTDEYAAEWIVNASGSFEDAVETIREQGTAWITSINRALGTTKMHTFVIAGYEGGVPVYAIVSNCETLTGRIRPISNELRLDTRRSSAGVHVFITGIRTAVPRVTRRRLKRLVEIGTPDNVVRFELAKVNKVAAASPEARNGISPECLTYSLDSNQGGSGEVHGDVPGPLIPRTVFAGIDLSKLVADMFRSSPNAKLVQSAVAASESNLATVGERIDCQLRVKKAGGNADFRELATVEEVGAINEHYLSLHDLNNEQWIVGQSRQPVGALPHAFAWPSGQEVQDLGTLGGAFSNAFSINDAGQIVGTAHIDQSATHAFLWSKREGMRDLGTFGGRDSVARSINADGQIVGESFVRAGDPKCEAERAFLWTSNAGMINLGDQFEGWSRAVAINRDGVVLGWRLRGSVVCGFVWSRTLEVVDIVGEEGRPFFPCAINDSGLVVGEGDDIAGKRRAFTWTSSEGLRKLAVPDDFHPSDVDVRGNVIGNLYSRPWSRPYLYRTQTDEFLPLPFIEEHHTSARAINDGGVIVGAAWAGSWKHSHALVWRLDTSLFLS
jgi:probable HAF family extracellular repeat protein